MDFHIENYIVVSFHATSTLDQILYVDELFLPLYLLAKNPFHSPFLFAFWNLFFKLDHNLWALLFIPQLYYIIFLLYWKEIFYHLLYRAVLKRFMTSQQWRMSWKPRARDAQGIFILWMTETVLDKNIQGLYTYFHVGKILTSYRSKSHWISEVCRPTDSSKPELYQEKFLNILSGISYSFVF